MIKENFNKLKERRIEQCNTVLDRKAAEYADDKDRLYNFKRAANTMGVPLPVAVLGMMSKHLVSVLDLAEERREFNRMVLDEKFTDLHNYLYFLEAAIVEVQETRAAMSMMRNKMQQMAEQNVAEAVKPESDCA